MAVPKGNKNAEIWSLEESTKFFKEALEISRDKEDYIINGKTIKGYKYHYIGEIASEFDSYSDVFKYLKGKFTELLPIYNSLKTRLESNCFSDSKRGVIKEATAIMNLKSNYGWTDRLQQDVMSNGKEISNTQQTTTIVFNK